MRVVTRMLYSVIHEYYHHRSLEERSRVSGATVSEVVREALRDALEERPLAERIGHLRGTLDIEDGRDPWRRELRERNWRR